MFYETRFTQSSSVYKLHGKMNRFSSLLMSDGGLIVKPGQQTKQCVGGAVVVTGWGVLFDAPFSTSHGQKRMICHIPLHCVCMRQ